MLHEDYNNDRISTYHIQINSSKNKRKKIVKTMKVAQEIMKMLSKII